jgi:uncharacterized protein YqfA (UPF0365 family)
MLNAILALGFLAQRQQPIEFDSSMIWWIVIIIAAIVALVFFAVTAQFLGLWIQAFMANANISIFEMIGMRLRKVRPQVIAESKIQAVKAGLLHISTNDIESHYLAGGNVIKVVRAMIAANRAGIPLEWKHACAIDLAGRDIFDAVQTSVNPKVIDVPTPTGTRTTIDAVAKDGIQLKAKARVTVRTAMQRLIGGATEETIIARVGEGIVTTIGSAGTYKDVLENPDRISKLVLQKGLDAGTAFEILSIDIADIDVGDNVGAKLQADQAEADMRRFQAEAEKRRALAIATEAEMRARTQENRAKVVEAEAQIPLAMAEAFRSGHMGIMDYYRMKNIQADTQMREGISPSDGGSHRGSSEGKQ